MGYDAKKAEAFNKLRQAGVPEDQALAQAGITDADIGDYALGSNGQLGALVVGSGKVAGVDYDKLTPSELQEQARFNQGLETVNFEEKASAPPSSVTPITYTTTSTQAVSGGGSTTIVAGPREPNATSQSIGNAYDAKNAEYNQFVKDNPSNFARKQQGLPPLTPEEAQQRQATLDRLNSEKAALKNQQIDAETPGSPSITTTPNTTTTSTTVQSYTTPTNADLNIQNDPAVFQQSETQLATTRTVATSSTTRTPAETPYVSVQTPQGNLIFPDQATYDAWQNNPQSVGFSTTPTGQLAQILPSVDTPGAVSAPANVGEDPYVSNGQSTITPVEQDVGEDPYVSNGQSTITPVTQDFGEDPYVSNGQSTIPPSLTSAAGDNQAAETKAKLAQAQQQATIQDRLNQNTKGDWRVRIRLAPDADYLYQDKSNNLLAPLRVSDGIVFPYTPIINTNYSAKYDPYDLTHSNYRGYFYRGSQISDINIQASFTAQDTREAEYVLAVIHFFRSATKMFYGQDQQRGAPPPLVYLRGYGEYQFNDHACVISNFQYNLPNDVDYISITPNNVGLNLSNRQAQVGTSPISTISSAISRLSNLFNTVTGQPGVPRGAKPGQRTDLSVVNQTVNKTGQTTYVPTKIDVSITLLPVQTRSQVSKQFSVKEFSNGNLLKKGFW